MNLLDRFQRLSTTIAFQGWYGWRAYGRHAAFLERSQWWPAERVQQVQWKKLKHVLNLAYEAVPYYRQKFIAADIRPQDINGPEDLACLPVLTKRAIQENRADLVVTGLDQRRLIENHTGGSTGEPLTFFHDRNFIAWSSAENLRDYRMAGYQLGMRWAFLWGSDYDARTHKGVLGRLKDRLVYNITWINTFDLSLDTLRQAAQRLQNWRPEILVAYVSSAVLFARLIQQEQTCAIRPKAIQTSAEVLTAGDRQLLEDTFQCPVFNRYGCREVGNIAHECAAHQGLHVLAENNLVELVDEAGQPVGPGQAGRILVTNLNNHAMPLIRYEIGDIGIASDKTCACGRGLPLIESVIGRSADLITSPGGKILHGEFFTHLFYRTSGVLQFRVTQEKVDELVIQIVPAPDFVAEQTYRFLTDTIQQHADPGFKIRFELHDQLAVSASGKYRFTLSKVPVEFS